MERQLRAPMSVGASSEHSRESFRARPMPRFGQSPSVNSIMLNEKKLTLAVPFALETEKRSISRL